MSQKRITIYYKTQKLKAIPIVQTMKPPTKNTTDYVVNLVSSDEDGALSDDSNKTIILPAISTPPPRSESPKNSSSVTSQNTQQNLESSLSEQKNCDSIAQKRESALADSSKSNLTTSERSKSPRTLKPSSLSATSPKKRRFYSPTKKRKVTERTQNSKRNLASMFVYESDIDSTPSEICDEHEDKHNNVLDTKTKFFLDIIQACLKDDSLKKLLNDEDRAILSICTSLPALGLRAICRLYWRRDGWYKKNTLQQIIKDGRDEIDNAMIEQVLKNLIDQNLLKQGTPGEITLSKFMTDILKIGDLKHVCKKIKLNVVNKNKQDLQELIEHYCRTTKSIVNCFSQNSILNNERRVLEIMSECAGPCYKLSEKCRSVLYKLYIISYLGIDYNIIRDKKLEFMLLNVIAEKETFPLDSDTKIDNASIVFENRVQFESYLSAHKIYEEFIATTNTEQRCNIVKMIYDFYQKISVQELERCKSIPIWLRRFTPGYIFVKILWEGLIDLKKGKCVVHCELAVEIITSLLNQDLFRQNKRAQWYNEKALILHMYLHKSNEAAQVLLEGLSSNLSDEEKDVLRRRAKYIAKLKNMALDVNLKKLLLAHAEMETTLESSLPAKHIYKQPMERHINMKNKTVYETRLPKGRIVQNVEEYALNHYIQTGEFTHGSHWEGKIATTLFSLIFWDIIYSTPPGVRGVFLNRYQQVPLDMYTEAFYTNRKTLIDQRLELIEHRNIDTMLELLELNWNNRPENEVSYVNRSVGWENLAAVVSCVGSRGVYVLCRRLARQFHYAHSGFPDLTLWNIHTKKVKFVEVKSDSDSPSMKQIQWMQYLIANGIDTEFCYVGANTHKRSRQNSATIDAS